VSIGCKFAEKKTFSGWGWKDQLKSRLNPPQVELEPLLSFLISIFWEKSDSGRRKKKQK
jgi:hypothetical protein